MVASFIFLLLVVLNALASAEVPFSCPDGRDPVRGAPVHTESGYALACADRQGTWQGPYQERFNNEIPAASGRYQNGKPDGTWIFFYRSGVEMMRGNFRSGQRDGQWTSFYENGNKLGEGPYRADVVDGHWTTWHENGAQKSEGSYRSGEEAGHWTYWYPNGQREKTGEYRGRRILAPRNINIPAESGKWTYWYENGRIRMEGCFRNGEQIGVWAEWSEDGFMTTRKMSDGANCH